MAVGSVGPSEYIVLCVGAVPTAAERAPGGDCFSDNACWSWWQCWQSVCHQSHQGFGKHFVLMLQLMPCLLLLLLQTQHMQRCPCMNVCMCKEQVRLELAQCLSVLMVGVMQATGTIKTTWPSVRKSLTQQAYIGVLLGGGLSGSSSFCLQLQTIWYLQPRTSADLYLSAAVGGFIRVFITDGSLVNSCAISLSLFMIVMTSVLTGTMLPFGLAKAGIDPANAGTSVQVRLLCLCD